MLKVRKFQLGKPDQSGQSPISLALNIENGSSIQARRLKVGVVVTDSDGFPFASTEETDDDFMADPREQVTWTMPGTTIFAPPAVCATAACVSACATLYARERLRIGVVDIPSEMRGIMRMERAIVGDLIDDNVRAIVECGEPGDEGALSLSCLVAVSNKGDRPIEAISLVIELLNTSDDVVVSTVSATQEIVPRSTECLEGEVWLPSDAKGNAAALAGGRVRLTLLVYRPIQTQRVTSPMC